MALFDQSKVADYLQQQAGDEKQYTVLVVDDEQDNLQILQDLLSREYRVIASGSGQEALKRLQEQEIHLIITDQRMPVMKGTELLEKCIGINPAIIRIILTAYTDINEIIAAINQGNVYKFITKPWSPEEMLLTVKRALESYQMRANNLRLIEQLERYNKELEQMVEQRTRELVEKDKLSTLGTMFAGLAHEIKNPLFGIQGPVDVIRKWLKGQGMENDDKLERALANIDNNVARIDRILHSIKTICYKGAQGIQDIDLEQAVRSVLDLTHSRWKDGVSIDISVPEGTKVRADVDSLTHILLNLVTNALDFMGDGGTLSIVWDQSGKTLSVQDTGRGIEPGLLPRLFDPFVTTREAGEGMGLGLHIVKQHVNKLGWNIEVDSTPGKGSTFTIHTG